MPKLTDTQLVILASAAKRDDGSILPLPKKLKLDAAAAAAVFQDLIKKKMIAEQPALQGAAAWRNSEDGPGMMLVVTDAGLRTIGAQRASELAIASNRTSEGRRKGARATPTHAGRQRPPQHGTDGDEPAIRAGTKQAQVIDLLRRGEGATIEELAKATGWQHHSIRGIISGALKKRLGLAITSQKVESGGRRYRIAE
jgi:hypothetical protein